MTTEPVTATTTTKPAAPKKKPAMKRAKKSARPRTAKTTTPSSYSNEPPTGLWPVGTIVKYIGGAKLKNDWLKKAMTGRVFGYRPGKKAGLYAIRFEGGATLLSVKRVKRVRKGGGTR